MTEPRPLYRSRTDGQIGGGCAGLAHCFGLEPLWVRLAFVLLALAKGVGVLLYIVLLGVIPREPLEGAEPQALEGAEPQALREEARNLGERAREVSHTVREEHNPQRLGWILVFLGGWFLLRHLGWLRISDDVLWPLALIGLMVLPEGVSMVWGLVLIVLGALWLLSNTGLFSWDVWNYLGQLWPLALILGGVGLVGATLLLAWNARPGAQAATEPVRIPLQGARAAEVRLRSGAGRLELGSLNPGSPNLIEGEIRLLPGERLEHGVKTTPGGLRVSLRSQGWVLGRARRTEGWKLDLSSAPALNLSVESGVQIELPGWGRYSARIKGGVG
jgi:phage shock protein PspC (stress-responsive transcriptional regulator)